MYRFKRNISLIGTIWLLCLGCQGDSLPSYGWTKIFGGAKGVGGHHHVLTVDKNGNIYITGGFHKTVDFHPGSDSDIKTATEEGGYVDVFVTKIRADGRYDWTKTIGGKGWDESYAIATDVSGNIYITGKFGRTVDFDPGMTTDAKTAEKWADDVFVTKLYGDGRYAWTNTFGGSGDDIGESIAVDTSGNIYVTGGFTETVDFDPGPAVNLKMAEHGRFFLSKFTANGDYLWTKTFGKGGFQGGTSVATDRLGNCYVTGSFNGIADFNPDSGEDLRTDLGLTDIFVMKFLANGDSAWCHTFGGRDYDRGMAIAVDRFGNLYITGYFMHVVDFDPTSGTDKKRVSGALDIFLTKFTTNGEYGWTKTFGGSGKDSGESLVVDSYGNIYLLGGRSVFRKRRDIFLAKISPEGQVLWKATVGGKDYDLGEGIAVDERQNFYILGRFGETVDFDFTASKDRKSVNGSNGSLDLFVTKYWEP